jgi:hypothetical protein
VQFTFSDGHAVFVSENIDINVYRGLITRNNGEVVSQY